LRPSCNPEKSMVGSETRMPVLQIPRLTQEMMMYHLVDLLAESDLFFLLRYGLLAHAVVVVSRSIGVVFTPWEFLLNCKDSDFMIGM
jgi:hypothetical protein